MFGLNPEEDAQHANVVAEAPFDPVAETGSWTNTLFPARDSFEDRFLGGAAQTAAGLASGDVRNTLTGIDKVTGQEGDGIEGRGALQDSYDLATAPIKALDSAGAQIIQPVADAGVPLASNFTIPLDDMLGTHMTDSMEQYQKDNANLIQAMKPDPNVSGFLSQQVYGLANIVSQAELVPQEIAGKLGQAGTVGLIQGYNKFKELKAGGMDDATAMEVSGLEGIQQGLGVVLPMGFGGSAVKRALTGAAINVGFGRAGTAATGAVLRANGYKDMADQYKVLDGMGTIQEAVMGAYFGINHNTGHVTPEPNTRDTDTALAAANIHNLEIDSAPGIPTDMETRNSHNAAMAMATDQLLRDQAVDLTGIFRESNFLPKPDDGYLQSMHEQMVADGYGDLLPDQQTLDAIGNMPVPDGEDPMEQAIPDHLVPLYQEANTVRDMVARAEKAKPIDTNNPAHVEKLLGYKPQSLVDFIVKNGGIEDTGGEFKAADITGKKRVGLIRKPKNQTDINQGSMLGGAGTGTNTRGLDVMLDRAQQAGYFKDKPDIDVDGFRQAIIDEVNGNKTYTTDDGAKIADAMNGVISADQYHSLGIYSNTPIHEVVQYIMDNRPDLFERDDFTPEEAAEQMDNFRRSTEVRLLDAQKGVKDTEGFNKIYNDVYEQLVASGQGPEQARDQSVIVANRYANRAERLKIKDSYGLFRDENIGIINGEDDENVSGDNVSKQSSPQGTVRGSIEFNNNGSIIRLFKDADETTFLHEMIGHQGLMELQRDAFHPDAPQQLRDDYQKALDFMGVEQISDVGRPEQEKFAEAFETYLSEGKAPAPGLEGVFSRLKDWLYSIYRGMVATRQPINDDIRGVFARMLASDDQIKQAEDARNGEKPTDTSEPVQSTSGTAAEPIEKPVARSQSPDTVARAADAVGKTDTVNGPDDFELAQSRVIAQENPDMLVADEDGNETTAGELMKQADALDQQVAQQSKLIDTAVNCFLRNGV